MDDRQTADMVPLADAVYKGVVADPGAWAARADELVVRARRDGPAEALVVALRAQAWAERLALHNTVACHLLDEAVHLAEAHGLTVRLGEVLVSRIVVHQELGRTAAARRDADRARGLLPAQARAELDFQQGTLLLNTGRLAAAADCFRRVLADPDCPAVVRAKTGNNLAHLQAQLGHTDAALELLAAAQAVADGVAPTVTAYVALTRAWVQVQGGRLAQSLSAFDEAHRAYVTAGLPLAEHHLEHSDALAGLRLLPEALAAARRGVRELPPDEVSLMAAEAQLRVARLCLVMGDPAAALTAADQACALLRAQRRPGWLARAVVVRSDAQAAAGTWGPVDLEALRRRAAELERGGLTSEAVEAHLLAGRLALAAGRRRAAAVNLTAVQRLSHGGPVLVRLRGHVAGALWAAASGQAREVLAACAAGLADVDRHRRALPSMELRVLASAHGEELGVLGLRALLAAGEAQPEPGRPGRRPGSGARTGGRTGPAAVFDWLERTRAVALATYDAGPDPSTDQGAGLQALHQELAALRLAGEPEPIALLRRVVEAEAAVRRASWSGGGAAPERLAVGRATRTAGVRSRLDGRVLVEFGLLDGAVFAVVVDRRRTRLVDLGSARGLAQQADSLHFGLRRLARPGSDPRAAAAAHRSAEALLEGLRDRLVRPLRIDPGTPLVVVPVGDLQRLPWSALHAGPTVVAPAAGVWLRTLPPQQGETTTSTVPHAGFGRVVLVAGPGLPGAAQEVAALAQVHPGAGVLAPPDSTCARTLEALRGAALAHLACHGALRSDNPAFSALLLQDGPLTVHELSRREAAPDRVVLAACESGAQVAFAGGEALGLVTALLARGSRGVIASGVLVPDEQALPLMVTLHRHLTTGASLSDALSRARTTLDPDDPHGLATWCAFDAYGAA